ncbi:MAG: hypothetical protein GY861_03875 [bacterium]|nr:hypothetical protein [bacterium]
MIELLRIGIPTTVIFIACMVFIWAPDKCWKGIGLAWILVPFFIQIMRIADALQNISK